MVGVGGCRSPPDPTRVGWAGTDMSSWKTTLRGTTSSRPPSAVSHTSDRGRGAHGIFDLTALALMVIGMSAVTAASASALGGLVRVVAVFTTGALALLVTRFAAPGWKALALAVIGGVTTVIASAIGMSHQRTGEVSLGLLGAALALTGGVLALGSAVTWMTRAIRGWRRVVALAVALVVGYMLFLPLGIAVYATNPPRTDVAAQTPADRGLTFHDARFPTADGTLLAGWYVPAATHAAVVLVPGSGSSRSAILDHATVLAHRGYGVLLVDPRGHGDSGGDAMEFGWYGDQDIAAAVTYLTQQPDVDPARIAVVGLSMGGEEAIGAIAADARIRAVVAEGATQRVWQDRTWLVDTYGIRGRLQVGIDAVTYGLVDLLTDAGPPTPLGDAAAAAAPRPILLIAGGDAPDEISAATAIQRRSPATVSLWNVPGADHIGGLTAEPAEWDRRVAEFLTAALIPAPNE